MQFRLGHGQSSQWCATSSAPVRKCGYSEVLATTDTGELQSASSETPLFATQASGMESMLLSQMSAETVYNIYVENCDHDADDGETDLSASNAAISIFGSNGFISSSAVSKASSRVDTTKQFTRLFCMTVCVTQKHRRYLYILAFLRCFFLPSHLHPVPFKYFKRRRLSTPLREC